MSDLGGSGTALNIDNITPTSRGERAVDTTLEGTGNVSATRNSAAEGVVHSSEPRGNFQQLASNDTGVQSFGSSTQSIEALLLQRTETLLNSLRSDATRPTLQCDNMLVPLLISAGYDDAAIMQTLLQHVRSEGDGTRVDLRAGTAMRQPYTPFGTAPPHSSHTATGPHTSFLPAGSAANSPANLQGTVDGFGPGPGARAVAQGGDPPGDVGASRVNQGTPFRANPPPLQAVSNTSSLLDAAVPRLDQGAALASGGGVDGCKPRGIAFQTSCLGAATGLHGPSVSFLHPNVPQMGSAASPTCIALGVSPSSMVGDLIGDCSGAGGGLISQAAGDNLRILPLVILKSFSHLIKWRRPPTTSSLALNPSCKLSNLTCVLRPDSLGRPASVLAMMAMLHSGSCFHSINTVQTSRSWR